MKEHFDMLSLILLFYLMAGEAEARAYDYSPWIPGLPAWEAGREVGGAGPGPGWTKPGPGGWLQWDWEQQPRPAPVIVVDRVETGPARARERDRSSIENINLTYSISKILNSNL